MFYLIGLGLGDERDISINGLEAIQKCDYLYLESYTSLLSHIEWSDAKSVFPHESDPHGDPVPDTETSLDLMEERDGFKKALEKLENFYNKKIFLADRYHVESAEATTTSSDASINLTLAKTANMALLVVGDPLSATTHTDLLLRCKQHGVPFTVIHNTSVMTAIGMTGLSLYKFTPTLSIPFFTDHWRPMSFYEKLASFRRTGPLTRVSETADNTLTSFEAPYHTLCLLDIKVKEPTLEEIARGRSIPRHFLPPRFMTVNQAIVQLLECEGALKYGLLSPDTMAIGCARLGSKEAIIKVGTLSQLRNEDFGPPLHSLILPCAPQHLHDLERDMLTMYKV